MPNKKNIETVKSLEERIKESPNLIVTGYQGLTTPEINDLKDKLKPAHCQYGIVKNTLTRIALKNIGLEDFAKFFTGPTAVAFQKGDPAGISKIVVEFAKKNEKLKIVAGYLDGRLLTEKDITHLASLPTREVLLTMVAVVFNQPIQRIATVLNAPLQKLALVLKSLEQQKAEAKS